MSEDKSKIVEQLFDPDVSVILAELEDGNKESAYLSSKLGIAEDEIRKRLDYLIGAAIVVVSENPLSYGVNSDKIAKIMENDENYKGLVDGLTELDSYLN